MTSYFIWYNSSSHKITRYFVGGEEIPISTQTPTGIVTKIFLKPTWTDEKDSATIFDDNENGAAYAQALKTKAWCEQCGYKGLVIEPIDEQKLPAKQIEQGVT